MSKSMSLLNHFSVLLPTPVSLPAHCIIVVNILSETGLNKVVDVLSRSVEARETPANS